MPEQTCCCGCCTVATGTLIIAILDIIVGIISVIRNAATAHFMITSPELVPDELYPGFKENPALYITMALIGVIMAIGYLILSGILLQGYRTKNHRLCMPWLYWNYFSLGLVAVFFVIVFFILVFDSIAVGFIILITGGIGLAIATYFVLVVQRFVDELKG